MSKKRNRLLRVISNSERGTFACERKWWFSYVEGLTTALTPAPLKQGTLVHDCLAAWYRSGMTMTIERILFDVVGPWLERRRAWAAVAFEGQDYAEQKRDALLQEDAEIAATSTAMVTGYMIRWAEADLRHLEIVAIEPQVARWLFHPETGKPIEDRPLVKGERRRRRWAYGGAIDLLVQDRRDGRFWFMEHKTTKDRDLQLYVNKLHFDPQIRGYAWALANPIPEVSDVKEPVEVAGVIYNVLRKKIPAVPAPVKDGTRLSRAKDIDTTREVFMAAIEQHGFDPGDYTEILARLEHNRFFAREPYPFTKAELRDFELDLGHHALRIRDASKPGVHHPRQVQICKGGVKPLTCPFESLCLEDGNFARASYRVKTIRHEELTGDLAEPYAAQERGLELADEIRPQSQVASTGFPDRRGAVEDPDDPFAALL